MSDVAPGWYSDPTNPLQERLWDGSEWLDNVRPRPPVSISPESIQAPTLASAQRPVLDLASKSSQTRRISGVTQTLIALAVIGTLAAIAVPAFSAVTDKSSVEKYAVGDVGPGGGRVFITPATAGNTTGLYFEAAPYADVAAAWCGSKNTLYAPSLTLGALDTAIGTGQSNTAIADVTCSRGAIQIASDYYNNGFSDWFLPSKDELNEMYLNRDYLGGFSNDDYWSSSEFDDYFAWYHHFNYGGQRTNLKVNTYYVRPVRAF